VPPQTPFTPFPTLQLKIDEMPDIAIPDFGDHPLGQCYTTLLRFLDRELKPLISMSEEINAKHPDHQSSQDRFDILTNVIWNQVGRAIRDELGSTVFAVGRPDEFQKACRAPFPNSLLSIWAQNYLFTNAFLSALESMSHSTQTIIKFREHPVSQAFEKRWQLTVYFQLRWKEIVGHLEESLSHPLVRPEPKDVGKFIDHPQWLRTNL
jgi:conserved oligomeric Golgi complex subunit 2